MSPLFGVVTRVTPATKALGAKDELVVAWVRAYGRGVGAAGPQKPLAAGMKTGATPFSKRALPSEFWVVASVPVPGLPVRRVNPAHDTTRAPDDGCRRRAGRARRGWGPLPGPGVEGEIYPRALSPSRPNPRTSTPGGGPRPAGERKEGALGDRPTRVDEGRGRYQEEETG